MQTQFTASQAVVIDVPEEPISIQHYLRQPRRLVYALFDPSRIEQQTPDQFRLKMRSVTFIMLSIQPVVDIRVWVASDNTVCVESIACEMWGMESVSHCFDLNLFGKLYPVQKQKQTQLHGRADLEIRVELPPALWFTPKPLIEATGNALLKSVLLTIKQRLMNQLLLDYQKWAKSTINSIEKNQLQGLPVNPPTI